MRARVLCLQLHELRPLDLTAAETDVDVAFQERGQVQVLGQGLRIYPVVAHDLDQAFELDPY